MCLIINLKAFNLYSFVYRWIKLRLAMLPHTIILEPLQDCFVSGILGGCCLLVLFPVSPLFFVYYFIGHLIYWISCDYLLIHLVQVLFLLLLYFVIQNLSSSYSMILVVSYPKILNFGPPFQF